MERCNGSKKDAVESGGTDRLHKVGGGQILRTEPPLVAGVSATDVHPDRARPCPASGVAASGVAARRPCSRWQHLVPPPRDLGARGRGEALKEEARHLRHDPRRPKLVKSIRGHVDRVSTPGENEGPRAPPAGRDDFRTA